MNNSGRYRGVNYASLFERFGSLDAMTHNVVDNRRRLIENVDSRYRLPVDQFSSQDFAISKHGWPLSDLALLSKAQSQKEFELAVSRLRELGLKGVDNSGKTVAQVLGDVLPSWVKTPAELQRYASYYSSFGDDSKVESLDSDDKKQSSDDKSVDKSDFKSA